MGGGAPKQFKLITSVPQYQVEHAQNLCKITLVVNTLFYVLSYVKFKAEDSASKLQSSCSDTFCT